MNSDLAKPSEVGSGDLAPAPSGLGSLVEAWLADKAYLTAVLYRGDLERFARWLAPEDPPPQTFERFLGLPAGPANETVLRYRNQLLADGYSTSTIAGRLSAIRSLVKLARQTGRVAWSIEIARPKKEPREDRSGPDDEARKRLWRYLRKADDPRIRRDRAIFACLFDVALRRGEVVSLQLEDLDVRLGTVSVRRKGKREKKTIRLPEQTRRDLEAWLVVRGNEPGPLFHRVDRVATGPLNGESLRQLVRDRARAAGVEVPVRPHGLRHAAITRAADLGKSLVELREFADHAKPETTMGYIDRPGRKALGVASEVARERK